jgi:hypothetical protein
VFDLLEVGKMLAPSEYLVQELSVVDICFWFSLRLCGFAGSLALSISHLFTPAKPQSRKEEKN